MLAIQEAGKQILTGNPGKFYIFVGEEYGIKNKYLEDMRLHYENWKEVDSVRDLFSMFKTKHLIPLKPTLYIVRYDEDFYSYVSDKTKSEIDKLNIIGTVVCIYQSNKHTLKFDKYLPDYTVSFDFISKQFIKKYLTIDFPDLNPELINFAAESRDDYNSAWYICNSLSNLESSVKISDLVHVFDVVDDTTETNLKKAFASRNYKNITELLVQYPNLDQVYYVLLNVLIELEKITKNTYLQSDLREYSKMWTLQDIYNMFMHTYEELKKVRSISSYSVYLSLMYLFSLSVYSPIPSVEVLK